MRESHPHAPELAVADLAALAGSEGHRARVGSDAPFLLDDDSVWLVLAGEVDLFAVRVEDGRPAGARAHLIRVGTGCPLFGLGPARDGRALLAVGTNGAELLRVPQSLLRAAAGGPHETSVQALVERWVETVCEGIARDVLPRRCAELPSNKDVRVEGSTSARPARSVAWVQHLEGHSLLLGRDGLRVNGRGLTPLSARAWLTVTEPSTLRVLDTAAAASTDALWDGLRTLHELALRCTAQMAEHGATVERERLRLRAAADREALGGACARLAATMEPGAKRGRRRRPRKGGAGDADPLLAACVLVGHGLSLAIKTVPGTEGAQAARDPLAAIARASRIRTRRVALRDDWWRHDCGPLLGYLAADNRPVALLPTGDRGYTLHDPTTSEDVAVTPAVAETLSPFAVTFYRPFPDVALKVRDVIEFGLHACGGDLWMVVMMGLAGALLGMIPAVATGMLFNSVIPGAQRSQLLQMTTVLVVCALATSMFTVARGVALLRVEGRMGAAVQAAVWDRLLGLPLPFFRPYAAGDLAVRAMGIDAIRQVVSGSTVTAIIGGIFSLGNFGLMFYYSPTMAWRATLLIAIAISITGLGSWLQLGAQRGVSAHQAKTSGLVLQLLSSVSKLRVAGAEVQAFSLWAQRFSSQRELQFRVRTIANWVTAFNAAFPLLANMLIFWTALPLLGAEHGVRTGDFLAFLSAYGSCQGALLATCMALLSTLNTIPLYEQAKPILCTLPEVDTAKSDPGTLAGDIEVQHAVFRYATDGPIVLRDITLHVKAGEFVAFVGPSGSGKSTLLRLLLGFERLESGAIYYDGQEIGGLDIQAVRQQIGVVLQTGRLMSGDIFTNIVGSSTVGMEEAWEAARMAGFADDITAMPMGMHTVISEGGGTLSGGQRQRLLIARAIVQRPRILLFDEATSALDNRTQAIVSASLERLNATRIVVAHRLSTIVNADRILVVERGRIVQTGTYDELMSKEGVFAELARRQIA